MRRALRAAVPLVLVATAMWLGGAATPAGSIADSDAVGREVWLRDCAVCHGADATGGPDGPDISEGGTAAIDFVVRTGRMPLADPDDQMERSEPAYDEPTIEALVDYARTVVDGPEAATPPVDGVDVVHGAELYTSTCAACHQAAGAGGALAHGATAPPLGAATRREVAEAIRTGPGDMPRYSESVLDEGDVADVSAYVVGLDHIENPGGFGLGRLGPVPEGLVALLGLAAAVGVARWLGTREAPTG